MAWKVLHRDAIDEFKHSWPCHSLPDDLAELACDFASNGDLVDIEARDDNGHPLDTHEFDGPALLALTHDCQSRGDAC